MHFKLPHSLSLEFITKGVLFIQYGQIPSEIRKSRPAQFPDFPGNFVSTKRDFIKSDAFLKISAQTFGNLALCWFFGTFY